MDYESLLQLPTGTDDIESLYKTGRGSTYAHHSNGTSTRNRSGENHRDKSTGIQRRSAKTIYMTPNDVSSFHGVFTNPEMATQFKQVLDSEGKGTNRAALYHMEDYGPRKAGSLASRELPFKSKPEVGLQPVEIWDSKSPIGSSGRGIHAGTTISEVRSPSEFITVESVPEKTKGPRALTKNLGKAGIAAGLAGAAGAASAGEYRKAAGMLGEMALPWWAGSSELATEEEALEKAKRAYGKKGGGAIKMPDNYSDGNWKLI